MARLWRHAADRVPPAGPAQGPALEGLRRGHPGRVREDPARAPPAEGLPRRPRDLPRRLLPRQPRQGDPRGLLRDRPARPPALGLRGRLVAVVGGRRLRDGVRRRDPHPDDVGLPAGRGAAEGDRPARRADPARRRPGRHPGPGRERGAVRVPGPRARRQRPARAARRHAARRQPGPRRRGPDPDPRDLPDRPAAGRLPDRRPGHVPVRGHAGAPGPARTDGQRRVRGFGPPERRDRRVHGRPTRTGDRPLLAARRVARDDPDAVVDVVRQPVRDDRAAREPRRARRNHVRLPGDRGERHLGRQQPGRPVHRGQRRRAVRRRALGGRLADVRARGRPLSLPAPRAERLRPAAGPAGRPRRRRVRRPALVRRARVLRRHRHRGRRPRGVRRGPR